MKICKGRRDRGGEKREETDRWRGGGIGWKIEQKMQLYFTVLLYPAPSEAACAFPGSCLACTPFPFSALLSSALLLALLWLPACTTVVLFTHVGFPALHEGTLMPKAPDF